MKAQKFSSPEKIEGGKLLISFYYILSFLCPIYMVAPLVSESQSSSIEEETDEQQQQYQQLARRRTIQSDLVDIEAESISSALPEGFNYEKRLRQLGFSTKLKNTIQSY